MLETELTKLPSLSRQLAGCAEAGPQVIPGMAQSGMKHQTKSREEKAKRNNI